MLKFYVADFWDRLRPAQKCGSLINSFFSSRKERGVWRIRTRAWVPRDICQRRRKPEIFKRGVSPHKSRRKQDRKTFILSPNILSKSSIGKRWEKYFEFSVYFFRQQKSIGSPSAVLKPQDIPSFFRVYELRSMQMDGWLMGRGAQKDIWQTQDNVNELLFSSLTQKSRTKLLFWHFSTKHSCLS